MPDDPVVLFAASVTRPGRHDALTALTAGRPVLVLAEGPLMYFEPDELRFFLGSRPYAVAHPKADSTA
ncbi:hypothetical protein [Streptomyces sp. AS58]|uniref:hypothetical protein n=1 Tax=Streptomyces sp. AS58 TaxID=1519489 RepID=UPI00131E7BED|nr:hypothetical protein [Streptomyces sp. AS58]